MTMNTRSCQKGLRCLMFSEIKTAEGQDPAGSPQTVFHFEGL